MMMTTTTLHAAGARQRLLRRPRAEAPAMTMTVARAASQLRAALVQALVPRLEALVPLGDPAAASRLALLVLVASAVGVVPQLRDPGHGLEAALAGRSPAAAAVVAGSPRLMERRSARPKLQLLVPHRARPMLQPFVPHRVRPLHSSTANAPRPVPAANVH